MTYWDLDARTESWTTGTTGTNRGLCRYYRRSVASALAEYRDRPYQRLPTGPEEPEQLGRHGRQPGEYPTALAERQFRWSEPVESQIVESGFSGRIQIKTRLG